MSNAPKRVWLSPPHLGTAELELVHDAFQSNWIAPLGPHLDAFERELAEYVKVPHVAALSSGTAALHLALLMLGVGSGDEVLVASLTFAASAFPVTYLGATPIFVDSERSTWNVSPELVEEAIQSGIRRGKKPKALIAVDLYGMPCACDKLEAICERYGVTLIEDAAEALGSTLHGKPLGGFGKIGILSFNGNKIITTSGGGALLSHDESFVRKAKFLSSQARDDANHYQHSQIGYNYRLSNVLAAIGRGQLGVIDQRVASRRSNHAYYATRLGSRPGVTFTTEPQGYFSNRWLTTMLINPEQSNGITREHIRIALTEANIECRPIWKPLHLQPVFAQCSFFGSGISDEIFDRGLCLPSGSAMDNSTLDRVCKIVEGILGE